MEEGLQGIVAPLLSWYRVYKRELPWRETKDPYRIWVSEIMLQQTRVEAVKGYYDRFLKVLPDIQSLAEAEEETILKLWEGLGYYNRVRNMQKAAIQIVDLHEGKMPQDFEDILALQGIGSYTAGAISSFAFEIPKPAVDGNVLRVLSRVLADDKDIMKQSTKKYMEKKVEEIIPQNEAGDFNQAMIEIGAIVCAPNGQPKCEVCPLESQCEAHKQGIEMNLPVKTKQKARKIEERTVLVLLSDKKTAIRKRKNKGLLAGLYELPNLEGHLLEEEVLNYVKGEGLLPLRIQKLEDSKHIFSHIEWHMKGYVVQIEEPEEEGKHLVFVEKQEMEERYSIPTAFQTYIKYFKYKF